MRHSDILVVGAGMAGLMAAVTAAKSGLSVSVLSEGAGVISIGSGAVDFLGYVNGKKITDNPFNHLNELDKNHPYNIIGAENIKNAFASLIEISTSNGYEIKMNDEGLNQTAISIAGTTKPTYICSESNNASRILKAKKILFAGVEYLKDAQPALAVKQAKQYKVFADAELESAILKSPFGKTHRVLNSLDLARYVDKEEGFNWLKSELVRVSGGFDAVIIPPICGTVNYTKSFKELQNLGFILVEAVSIPPGVGGYRLRNALISEAKKLDIKFIENCNVQRAVIENGKCKSLFALHNNIAGALETEYSADKFIIATGGVIGGGIASTPDKVYEKIFNIEIKSPASVEERSDKNVFGSHIFTKFGVNVNNKLQVIDSSGSPLYDNVFFAGNTLSDYDFPTEKSGYGVACSTGYTAALSALSSK
ncbi:MAG: anaerobic glycerol-3-phosphate dehydrogenase subunit B [Mucispirillum sp.]|uniref:Anaerobic glycerol-3-phosphate dehydrogenase subunit B n=1 Tax=Candidatus Mucispirillum faecigallinarum TaxID=2838699 RepID=A0A9D2GUH8_9BACT|nr:anaerobic glycerol-3-phosphate dehydrogenase subunit B [Mucispirillum sp.]HIZ89461.1 anaerobic glycerol-3-phosphate dehydrogenase subunit B [Candidatus Mucispirillum faecigallinarum]